MRKQQEKCAIARSDGMVWSQERAEKEPKICKRKRNKIQQQQEEFRK